MTTVQAVLLLIAYLLVGFFGTGVFVKLFLSKIYQDRGYKVTGDELTWSTLFWPIFLVVFSSTLILAPVGRWSKKYLRWMNTPPNTKSSNKGITA